MSYLAREYIDSSEPDNQDYEKSKPEYFRKYMNQQSAPIVQHQNSPQEIEPYYRKYMKEDRSKAQPQSQNTVPQVNRGFIEQNIQRPFDIISRGAAGMVGSLPQSLAQTGAALKNWISPEGIQTSAPSPLKKGKGKEFKAPEWFKNIFPTYGEFQEKLQKAIPGLAQAETPLERAEERFGQAFPFALGGGGPGLVGAGASSAAMQTAQEKGAPLWLQIAAGMGADLGVRGIIGAANPSRALAGSRPFAQNLTPELAEYIQASTQAGIDPIAAGGSPTQTARAIQKWTSLAPGGYEAAHEAYQARSGQVAREFGDILDSIGAQNLENPQQAGTLLRDAATRATQQIERTKSNLYQAVENTIPPNDAIRTAPGTGLFAPNLNQVMTRARDQLNLTLRQSHPESRVHHFAQEALNNFDAINQPRNQLLNAQGQPIATPPTEIGVRQLEAFQRSLREVMDFNIPGGPDKLLRPIDREVSRLLQGYARQNPQYGQAKALATNFFRREVVPIRENIIQSIVNHEVPEYALSRMNTPTGIDRVAQALQHIPDGQHIFDSLRRFQLNRMLQPAFFDPNSGLMKTGGLANFLNKENRHVIERLAGRPAYQRLQNLQHVGRGLDRGFNVLKNPSASADTAIALSSTFAPPSKVMKGLATILTAGGGGATASGNIGPGLGSITAGTALWLGPRIINRVIYSPEFARNVYRAAQAGNRGRADIFARYLSQIENELNSQEEE